MNNMNIHPHVLIFPLPLQGPVNCMLKLAELILSQAQAQAQAHNDLSITFVNTQYIQRRLALHSDAVTRLARFGTRFRFEVVPDGLGPEENPPVAGQIADLTIYLQAQAQAHDSRLREVLANGSLTGPGRSRVTCIIADGFYGFMVDVAKEIGVPLVYFETISPCGLWTYLCVPRMVQARELPFQGDDLDEQITSVPGMENYLRRRDLPSFCRCYDPNNNVIQLVLKEAQYFSRAQGHIFNTFDDLEDPLLPHFRALCPNLYNIGPLHLHFKTRLQNSLSTSNSLWQEDTSCLSWLDAQPPKSVLFVSIGSVAVMKKHQLIEFWHGLVNSETRFLWVQRPGSIIGGDHDKESDLEVPIEVLEGSGPIYVTDLSGSNKITSEVQNLAYATEARRERGFVVSWVPQEEVLAHRAIGGFLTHSGWNSTLESIVESVPMICWPYIVDQQVNSRVVGHVWRIGLDMKDTCDRVVIENMVRNLMGAQRDEFAARASEMAKLAAQAVSENGSSYSDLNRLIEDIQFMRLPISNNN